MLTIPVETLFEPALRARAGGFVQHGYDVDTPWHSHDMHQLQYAFEGAIEVQDARARHLLPRQLAAWIPAGVAHRTSLHHVRSGSVLFSPDMVPNAGDHVRIIEVSPLMREMVIAAMRWPLDRPQEAISTAYFEALALLCGEWIRREAELSLPTSADPALQAAMDHVRGNLCSATMTSTCQAVALSERTLRRRFKHQVGLTWDDYRRRARLLAATELLVQTQWSIGRIAAEVGFESQSSFAKAFRAGLGKSPRDFRS